MDVLAGQLDEGTLKVVTGLLQSGIDEAIKEEIIELLGRPYSDWTEDALFCILNHVYDPTMNVMYSAGLECFVTGCSEARVSRGSFCETHKATCFIEEDRPGKHLRFDVENEHWRAWTARGWRWVEIPPDWYDEQEVRALVRRRKKLDHSLEVGEIRRAGTTPWGASIYERNVVSSRLKTILDGRGLDTDAILDSHSYGARESVWSTRIQRETAT